MLADVKGQLDAIDAKKAGGLVELRGFAQGGLDHGRAGAAVRYEQRLRNSLSAFLEGSGGAQWGAESGPLWWQALGGLRWTF